MDTRGKTVEVLAYAAGVVDSDGHIGVSKKTVTPAVFAVTHRRTALYSASVTVTNTDRGLMDWFQAEFGGRITVRKKVQEHHKTTYSWVVSEQQASAFCQLILPYLRVKKRQAVIVIELKDVMLRYLGRRGTPRSTVDGRLTGFVMPPEEVERRETLYQEAKVLNDDRRPHRLIETASGSDEVIVSANGKPLEGEETETISPGSSSDG